VSAAAQSDTPLRIGILVDTTLQQHALREAVKVTGHHVGESFLSKQSDSVQLEQAQASLDAWLVEVDFTQRAGQRLESWLAHNSLPVIIGEGLDANPGSEDYQTWLRRLSSKLRQLNGQLNLDNHPSGVAKEIWVLGASTGGPEAVKRFVEALPANLGVAFVYVQHIDTGFEQTLTDVISRKGLYPAYQVKHGDVLHANGIAVLRSDQCVEILENGTLLVKQEPWPGPYSPSVDQVIANVARNFPGRSGAIIFSGMGNDGAVSSRLMRQRGGPVWVQSPETCACPSMPEAVIDINSDSGHIDAIGNPEALATAFLHHIKKQETKAYGINQ
jgi:chemosensory pili system protein ChpB (putative protein-glutamate methylesterase)